MFWIAALTFGSPRAFIRCPASKGDILVKLLPDTEAEFARQPKLRTKFGWFHDEEFTRNRGDNLLRLSAVDAETVKNTDFWLRHWVRSQRSEFLRRNLNPPSPTDRKVLAHAAIVGNHGGG